MELRLRERTVNILLLLGCSVYQLIESSKQAREAGSSELFPCLNLSNAHYNYLKPPGESVTITCLKNCTGEGTTQWYHSYVKVDGDMRLLAWSGTSHEAAVTEIPSHGSLGFFCCACEEDENPGKNGCCWGVAYQPVVNLTIRATKTIATGKETVVPVGTNLSLRCEVRGFPRVSLKLTPPPGFDRTLANCREVEKSWYSTVTTCHWTGSQSDSGVFGCTGSILMDSLNNEKVKHNESASHHLSVYSSPRLVRLYQATQLKVGSQFKLVCQIDCSPVASCSVIWYFKGVIIDPEKDHKYEISSDGLLHNLTLEEPGREDLGQYACVLKSQFGTTEDSRTITVTLPAEPTRQKDLPGPVEDRSTDTGSQKEIVTRMLVVLCIIIGSLVIMLAAVAYLILSKRWRQKSLADRVRPGGPDTTDRESLIESMADEDTATDGVVTASRRRGTRPGKKTRHRPSSKK